MIITTVLIILFMIAEIEIPGSNTIQNNLGLNMNNTEGYPDLDTSDFFNAIFSAVGILTLTTAAAAGVALAYATQSPAENYIIAPIITTHLVVFVSFLFNLSKYLTNATRSNPVISSVIFIILTPLTIGYIIACVEFFRGTD